MLTVIDYFTDANRPTFLDFGQRMERELTKRCGLGVLDLPDQDYSSLHEEWNGTDKHIADMATEILAGEGFYDDGQPDEAQEWYDFDPDC